MVAPPPIVNHIYGSLPPMVASSPHFQK